jgi:hypothetical protein
MENNSPKARCEKLYEHYNNCIKELVADTNEILKRDECNILMKKYKSICDKK